jgi:cytochrome c oxidase cbb3-type subunit 4
MDPNVIEKSGWLDRGQLQAWITVATVVVYAGIFWWAYHRGNRERFEQDALLPFMDDDGVQAEPGAEEDAR